MWNVVLIIGIVYIFYIVIGGLSFMLLEQLDALGVKIVLNTNTTTVFADMESTLLENFSQSDIDSVVIDWKREMVKNYFSTENVELEDLRWTYSNSFFFAFHLCSTIGYGNVAPTTAWGQITAMLYALIGIPLHLLFFKILGESFALSYQDIMSRIKGDDDSPNKERLGNLAFFLPWTIVFFVLPSIVFMFMESWNFTDGIYYSFITLSTIGLGDYEAGSKVTSEFAYTIYKLIILAWMIYGLAFTSVVIDFATHLFQMNLLYSFRCSWRRCSGKLERIYVDIEKMDVHFKLIRAEAVKPEYSMWAVREGMRQAVGFRANHMVNLASLSERIQGELIDLFGTYDEEEMGTVSGKTSGVLQDAFPVKKMPKDSFPVRKNPTDTLEDRTENNIT